MRVRDINQAELDELFDPAATVKIYNRKFSTDVVKANNPEIFSIQQIKAKLYKLSQSSPNPLLTDNTFEDCDSDDEHEGPHFRYVLNTDYSLFFGNSGTVTRPGKTAGHLSVANSEACYAAGDVAFDADGRICEINNISSGFRPDVKCLQFALWAFKQAGFFLKNDYVVLQLCRNENQFEKVRVQTSVIEARLGQFIQSHPELALNNHTQPTPAQARESRVIGTRVRRGLTFADRLQASSSSSQGERKRKNLGRLFDSAEVSDSDSESSASTNDSVRTPAATPTASPVKPVRA